ncbi:MAG: serine/threonine protein kinase [Bdellovibrionota bacterium]|jgi:serine/threonine protein kinase
MAEERFLQSGTLIAGRYEVIKCLGAGSMGLVYACRDRELAGRIIAAKVLFPEVAQDKVAAQRFRNEVFAAYDVSHPNVVRAYEFIRDGDIVAYTMEYVGGGDLASRLAKQDKMSIHEVLSILSQMCLGVQAIHDAKIIHRDLKPENIMLTKDGCVKIADFGIARLGHGPKLTEHGGVVGTIDYVSPEYMLNSQVDWRSDIYAIGILGYEMIAGQAPFRGDSVYATMTKRLKSDPDPISKYRSDCPPELEKIILRAMARDPEKRFQSAREMYEAFHNIEISYTVNDTQPDEKKPDLSVLPTKKVVEKDAPFVGFDEYGEDLDDKLEETIVVPVRHEQDGLYGDWLDSRENASSMLENPFPEMCSSCNVSDIAGYETQANVEFKTDPILRQEEDVVATQEVVEIASQYYLNNDTVTSSVLNVANWKDEKQLQDFSSFSDEPEIIKSSIFFEDTERRHSSGDLSRFAERHRALANNSNSLWLKIMLVVLGVVISIGALAFCLWIILGRYQGDMERMETEKSVEIS